MRFFPNIRLQVSPLPGPPRERGGNSLPPVHGGTEGGMYDNVQQCLSKCLAINSGGVNDACHDLPPAG